jgi:hypothetical protein
MGREPVSMLRAVSGPAGIFEPEMLERRVRGSSSDYADRVLLRDLQPWQKWVKLSAASGGAPTADMCGYMRFEGALSHETVHLFQSAATPLGLALGRLRLAATRMFVQAGRTIAARQGFLPKPLVEWITAHPDVDPAATRDLQAGHSAELLRLCLLGSVQAELPLEHPWANAAPEGGFDSGKLACPEPQGRGPIGAQAVWEGSARWIECAYRAGGWSSPAHWSERYVRAPELFVRLTGLNCLPKGVRPNSAGLTFLAVCEVAAGSPLEPAFASASQTALTWRDLHPGWRFLAACRAVGEVRPLCDATEPPDVVEQAQEHYRRFSDDLSEVCGWPSPHLLARIGAVMEPADDIPRADGRGLHHNLSTEEAEAAATYRSACELRLRHPGAFGLADFSPATLAEAERVLDVMPTLMDHGAWVVEAADADDPARGESRARRHVRRRAFHQVHALVRQLAFERGGFRCEPPPTVVRTEESAARFDKTVADFLAVAFGVKPSDIRMRHAAGGPDAR